MKSVIGVLQLRRNFVRNNWRPWLITASERSCGKEMSCLAVCLFGSHTELAHCLPRTKLWKSNVFSRVYLSVCLVPIHSPSPQAPFPSSYHTGIPKPWCKALTPRLSSPRTCSNLFTIKPYVCPQTVGWHSTEMSLVWWMLPQLRRERINASNKTKLIRRQNIW